MLNYQRVDHLEKYEFVNWDDYSQYMEKIYKKKHQPLLLYPKILRFDTVYHHFPLQVWGIRHFWTNKNVAEGEKKGNRWAFHTKQETCSSVGFDFPEEECNMMGRKIMFQIENGRI
jgi:hypothetical protein